METVNKAKRKRYLRKCRLNPVPDNWQQGNFFSSPAGKDNYEALEVSRNCINDDDGYTPGYAPRDGFFIYVGEDFHFLTFAEAEVLHEWLGRELEVEHVHPQNA